MRTRRCSRIRWAPLGSSVWSDAPLSTPSGTASPHYRPPGATLRSTVRTSAGGRTMAVTTDTFVHEALLYEGVQGFVDGALPFVREGLDAGEPMLVAVGPEKIARLRAALGAGADAVQFVDM